MRSCLPTFRSKGFVRVRVNGELRELGEKIELEKNKKHNIEVVVDRIVVKEDVRSRLADSLETALKLSGGQVIVDVMDKEELLFSSNLACPDVRLQHRRTGAAHVLVQQSVTAHARTATGSGAKMIVDPDLLVPDPSKID